MKPYVITSCSTADMDRSYFEQRQIPFAIFHYTLNGKEYPDDLYRSVLPHDFFSGIANGDMPVTSQVNTLDYKALWEPFLKEGTDVLHLTLSSGISGTYNSACIARDELNEDYPEQKVIVIDSLAASSGYGLLTDQARDNQEAGMSLEENADWILKNRNRLHHWFFVTDLTCLVRGGRVTKAAGFFGGVLKICPLLNVNSEGKLIPREKIRTKKKVIQQTCEKMKEHASGGTAYSGKCFMSHSDCYEDARALADLVEATFPRLNGKVEIHNIGTVIGSHTGPGTVALFFWGDERTL